MLKWTIFFDSPNKFYSNMEIKLQKYEKLNIDLGLQISNPVL